MWFDMVWGGVHFHFFGGIARRETNTCRKGRQRDENEEKEVIALPSIEIQCKAQR